jgi:predicted lipoprotein with Yx(FWY)xxD motif
MRKGVLIVLVAAALAAPAAAAGGTVVKTAPNPHLGDQSIIVDSLGRTLYYFASDVKGKKPSCVNDPTYHCVKLWPPLITSGKPVAGEGATQSLLGLVKRTDGRMQVTYGGRPLYRLAGGGATGLPPDKVPGDAFGQAFVGLWYVLSPAGKPIKTALTTP